VTSVRKLPTRVVEKVWGRHDLPSPFPAPGDQPIGEIWFEPPSELSQLLVKYLFTSEKLSVQVHPSDKNALPGEAGKEECWLVLDAEEDARLAIGFTDSVAPQSIVDAARAGTIEEMLTWHPAQPGDFFYLPAGTVHAIGAGLTLIEVQQNSDTTFRLYDYGRPRELHLDRAMAVSQGCPYPSEHKGCITSRGQTLVDGNYFRLDRVEGLPESATRKAYQGPLLVLPLQGAVGSIAGDAHAIAGECLYSAGIDVLDFSKAKVTLLVQAKA
jgi:mannose-6-phosphate isomerase